jgi:hypothetical protein
VHQGPMGMAYKTLQRTELFYEVRSCSPRSVPTGIGTSLIDQRTRMRGLYVAARKTLLSLISGVSASCSADDASAGDISGSDRPAPVRGKDRSRFAYRGEEVLVRTWCIRIWTLWRCACQASSAQEPADRA